MRNVGSARVRDSMEGKPNDDDEYADHGVLL